MGKQEKRYHAIQVIVYGKRKIFVVCLVCGTCINPGTVPGRFRSEAAAREAAATAGIDIAIVGDCYHIIAD